MRRMFVAGNWKMNTDRASAVALARAVSEATPAGFPVDVAVAPPFPYLLPVGDVIRGTGVELAAQNASAEKPGAFTGETALDMLGDVGCRWVILGHSERRALLGETDPFINRKVQSTLDSGLGAILCIGETLEERDAERTTFVLETQLHGCLAGITPAMTANLVVAYEPVWAIGTGRNATPDQAQQAHAFIRQWLVGRFDATVANMTRILYGGSVKADNAFALLGQADVDGALVGGASLKATDFLAIINAAKSRTTPAA